MSGFDPKAYLAAHPPPAAFDPKAYLAQNAPAMDPEEPGIGEAFVRGGTQGLTLGLGDELWGAARAVGDSLPESLGGAKAGRTFLELYRQNRDSNRAANDAAERAHGGYYLGGNLAGGLATAPLMPGSEAKGLWQLIKAGAKAGAGLGGAVGFGGSSSELTPDRLTAQSAWDAAKDTGKSALAGAVLGGALPVAAKSVEVAGRAGSEGMKLLRGGYISTTPEAQRLAAEGVNLTMGRRAPQSLIGKMEELASGKVTGGALAGARSDAETSARDALLRKMGAPGATPPTAGAPVAQQIGELGAGYGQAYENAVAGHRLSPEAYEGAGKWRGFLTDPNVTGAAKTRGAFELATSNPNIIASPADRETVAAWLEQQAKSLPKVAQEGGSVKAEHLQAMRSELRSRAREMLSGTPSQSDRAKAEMIRNASDFVTELMENQLPKESVAALRATDASYNNLRAARAAAKTAFVQNEEFTPGQLLQSIRTKGSTPDVEALARDAHQVLGAKYAKNGWQGAALEGIPGGHAASQLVSNAINFVPALRQHALTPLWSPGAPSQVAGFVGSTAHDLASSDEGRQALIRAILQAHQGSGQLAGLAESDQ